MILRDPVHGLVSFEAEEEEIVEALLETKELQRLRGVRQLGLTSLAYPGADHTRFSHAVGTAHVMRHFIARIRSIDGDLPCWQRLTSERAREALAAALLHDVGHGPFSHLFESALPDGVHHEQWSTRIVLDESTEVNQVLRRYDSALPQRVADLISGQHELPYLARAVSGMFDVDRCDYLLRDAHFTGVNYGRYDLEWLLRSFCLGSAESLGQAPGLSIDGTKGLPAIESFTLARLFMFQQVYFHKASRASEFLLTRILDRVRNLLLDGTDVRGVPSTLRNLILGPGNTSETSLHQYLRLDDSIIWSAFSEFTEARDPVLADLSRRLLHRKLFKSFDLFGDDAEQAGRAKALAIARSIAEERGLDPDLYVGLDMPQVATFDDSKDPLTVLFPDGSERRPGDVSFLLSRLRGQVLSRPRLIFAEEIRDALTDELGNSRAPSSSPPAKGVQQGTLAGGSFAKESIRKDFLS